MDDDDDAQPALDKLEQWDMPSEAFNAWWDSDYDNSANPYEKDTFAYWAWAGWQAALAQPAQEPICPECKAGVLYECVACSSNNYPPQGAQKPVAWMYDWLCEGKLITGWIANSDSEIPQLMGSNIRPLYTAPPQRPWVDLTRTQIQDVYFAVLEEHRGDHQMQGQLAFGEALQYAIKEKNK